MKPVEPTLDLERALHPDTRRVVFAASQPQYNPLVALVEPDGRVHTLWELEANELRLLQAGAYIQLEILTFNRPLQPLLMTVSTPPSSPPKWRARLALWLSHFLPRWS